MSDEELASKREEFRERINGGETLNQILPDAFAVCREVSRRTLGLRHFDVQMVGGMTLHGGSNFRNADRRREKRWWRPCLPI